LWCTTVRPGNVPGVRRCPALCRHDLLVGPGAGGFQDDRTVQAAKEHQHWISGVRRPRAYTRPVAFARGHTVRLGMSGQTESVRWRRVRAGRCRQRPRRHVEPQGLRKTGALPVTMPAVDPAADTVTVRGCATSRCRRVLRGGPAGRGSTGARRRAFLQRGPLRCRRPAAPQLPRAAIQPRARRYSDQESPDPAVFFLFAWLSEGMEE